MNGAMLHQLLWLSIIYFLELTAGYIINPDFDQCDRLQCYAIDDIFEKNVNSNIEPCQDFLQYACGSNDSHRIPNMYFTEPTENSNFQDLEEILSGTVSLNSLESGLDALKIEKEIYKKCQRVGVYSENEKEQYRHFLSENGKVKSYEHWSLLDLKYARIGFGFAFFNVDIVERENPQNRELRRYIQISPPTDNVMDMNDLLMSRYMEKLQSNQHKDFLYSSSNFHSEVKNLDLKKFINDFNKIVPYEKSNEYFFIDNSTLNLQTIAQWHRKYNENALHPHSQIYWYQQLYKLFNKVDKKLDEDEPIIIVDEQYFFHLIELFSQTSSSNTIVEYINLRFISKTIGWVLEEYKDKYSIIPPIKGLTCTPGLLVGAAHAYAKQYFPRDTKETVEVIFAAVRSIVKKQLTDSYNSRTIPEATKSFLRQLSHFDVLVGYPDWLYDETIVKRFYDNVIQRNSDIYFVKQINSMEVLLKHKLRALSDSYSPIIDIKLFFKSFTDEKISFSKNFRQIVLPMRALSENNFKFVSAHLYDPINYGAAGTIIASELYLTWLKSIAYDQNAAQCMWHQIPDNLNKLESNEYLLKATAYMLGLRTAFLAWPSKDSYPIQFPKFGAITDYSLFFLSFAEAFCTAQKEAGTFQPYEFINLAVSNLGHFAEAFQCHANSKMNLRHRCNPLTKH